MPHSVSILCCILDHVPSSNEEEVKARKMDMRNYQKVEQLGYVGWARYKKRLMRLRCGHGTRNSDSSALRREACVMQS